MPRVIELFVDQFLAIDQGVPDNNPQGLFVTQTIDFNDFAKNYRTVVLITQQLFLGQTVHPRRSIYNLSVSDYLAFYQKGGNGPELQTVTQFFHMHDSAKLVEFEQLVQALTLTQTAEVTVSKVATNTLVMTDAASCNIVKPLIVLHTLVIGSNSSGYLFDEDFYSIDLPTLAGPNAPEFP